MRYRTEIDGLRAVAVLPVIAHHAGFPFLPGGFIGVDVFFVISGFLIGGIVHDEVAAGRFSLAGFYERRARRILPALGVVLLVVLAASALAPPPVTADIAEGTVATILFASNFYFWQTIDYFAGESSGVALIHTWSLAVEEQFYLFFPLVVMALWRLAPRLLMPAVLAGLLLSLVLAEVAAAEAPRAAFYLLPTRAWELLAGVAMVLLLRRRPDAFAGRRGEAAGAIGLAAIIASYMLIGEDSPWPGLWALPAVLGTALVLGGAVAGTLTARVLSWRPLVGVGLVSYSAYLWHQPMLAGFRIFAPRALDWTDLLLPCALTLVAAWATWRFVEQPFRDRRRLGPRAIAVASGVACGVPLVVALGLMAGGDALRGLYLDRLGPEARARYLAAERLDPRQVDVEGPCILRTERPDAAFEARLRACTDETGPAIAVIGDSHAVDIFEALAMQAPEQSWVLFTGGGCRPVATRYEGCHPADLAAFLAREGGHFARVIYTQAGFWLNDPPGNAAPGRFSFKTARGEHRPDRALIGEIAGYLDTLALHADLVWLGPRIEPHVNHMALHRRAAAKWRMDPALATRLMRIDRAIAEYVAGRASAFAYVSQIDTVGFDMTRDFWRDGSFTYSDGDHYSVIGKRLFGARLAPALLPAAYLGDLAGPGPGPG